MSLCLYVCSHLWRLNHSAYFEKMYTRMYFGSKISVQEIIFIINAYFNQEFPKNKFKISHKNLFILSLYLKEVSDFAVHLRLGCQPIPHRFALNIFYITSPSHIIPTTTRHAALPHLTLDYHHPHYLQSWLHLYHVVV